MHGDLTATRVVIIVLVVISAAATFYTQILVRQSQVTVPVGTAATVQRLMLVGIPVSVLFSGLFFPLGVLLYWFTSNVWTMGQQLYINKFHPHIPKEAPPAGELGKSLAPKPGQKPIRTDRRVVTPPPETPDGTPGIRSGQSRRRDSLRGRHKWRLERIRSATVEHTPSGTTPQPAGRRQFEPPGREASESVQKATVIAP